MNFEGCEEFLERSKLRASKNYVCRLNKEIEIVNIVKRKKTKYFRPYLEEQQIRAHSGNKRQDRR